MNVTLCTCEVITGGHVVPSASCPVHTPRKVRKRARYLANRAERRSSQTRENINVNAERSPLEIHDPIEVNHVGERWGWTRWNFPQEP